MRFLFVTSGNPYGRGPFGGAETSIRLLAERMAARGHHVHYLVGSASAMERATAGKLGVNLIAPTRWTRLLGLFSVMGKKRRVYEKTISRLAQEDAIDIAYVYYEVSVLEAVLRARSSSAIKRVVMRMAGLRWHLDSLKSKNLKSRFRRAFTSIDSVNFISFGLAAQTDEKFAELDMPVRFRDRFCLDIGSSTPSVRMTPYRELVDRPFQIIMASRFSDYQKRQDLLVRAMALLPDDMEVRLTLIGDGPRLDAMQRLAHELGQATRISFLPFSGQEALWKRFEKSHLMCHATDYEGLGKVIVEGMSMGVPVLGSNVTPLNEYIVDGETGFLVENTPEAWAARITDLYTRRDDLAQVSDAAMTYAQQVWDASRNAAAYERHFKAILKGRANAL